MARHQLKHQLLAKLRAEGWDRYDLDPSSCVTQENSQAQVTTWITIRGLTTTSCEVEIRLRRLNTAIRSAKYSHTIIFLRHIVTSEQELDDQLKQLEKYRKVVLNEGMQSEDLQGT